MLSLTDRGTIYKENKGKSLRPRLMRGNKEMKNVIELRKLSKVYKDVTTVNLEKITVREGEI